MFYVVQDLGPGSSHKGKELGDSRTRAHAANVSHKRRTKNSKILRPTASSLRQRTLSTQTRLSGGSCQSKQQDTSRVPVRDGSNALSPIWVNSILHENESDIIRQPLLSSIPLDRLGIPCDPFMYTIRRRSYDTSMAIDFYTKLTMPTQAPVMKIFNVTNSYLFSMLGSPSSVAVLDAGVGTIRTIFDRAQRPSHDLSCLTISYINRGMFSVRRTIGQLMHHCEGAQGGIRAQVLDSTITAMILLAFCGDTTKNWNTHTVHRQGLIALIKARGGIDKFNCCDGQARCALLKLDANWVLNGETTMFPSHRPVYNPLYPSVPFSVDFLSQVSILPSGFQALAHMRMLALDLIEVLTRTAAAQARYKAYRTVADPEDLFRSGHRRFNDFWEACTCFNAPDETINALSENGDTISIASPNLQKLIVLSLILYCYSTFAPKEVTTPFYQAYRTILTRVLPRKYAAIKQKCSSRTQDTDEEKWQDNVLLWISLVVIDSCQEKNDASPESGVDLLKMVKKHYSKLIDWIQVEQRLKSFFHNEGFLTRCAEYWKSKQ